MVRLICNLLPRATTSLCRYRMRCNSPGRAKTFSHTHTDLPSTGSGGGFGGGGFGFVFPLIRLNPLRRRRCRSIGQAARERFGARTNRCAVVELAANCELGNFARPQRDLAAEIGTGRPKTTATVQFSKIGPVCRSAIAMLIAASCTPVRKQQHRHPLGGLTSRLAAHLSLARAAAPTTQFGRERRNAQRAGLARRCANVFLTHASTLLLYSRKHSLIHKSRPGRPSQYSPTTTTITHQPIATDNCRFVYPITPSY